MQGFHSILKTKSGDFSRTFKDHIYYFQRPLEEHKAALLFSMSEQAWFNYTHLAILPKMNLIKH